MPGSTPRKQRLLVIDDNATNLKVAVSHLQAYGLEVLHRPRRRERHTTGAARSA